MKHVSFILLMIGVAVVFFLIMLYGEDRAFLYERVIPAEEVTLDLWMASFRYWATWVIGCALVASLSWYALGQWGFKLNEWENAKKRPVWFLLAVLPIIVGIVAVISTPDARAGHYWAYAFYFFNGIMVYYLATVLFSPTSFKYTPPGAAIVRQW